MECVWDGEKGRIQTRRHALAQSSHVRHQHQFDQLHITIIMGVNINNNRKLQQTKVHLERTHSALPFGHSSDSADSATTKTRCCRCTPTAATSIEIKELMLFMDIFSVNFLALTQTRLFHFVFFVDFNFTPHLPFLDKFHFFRFLVSGP